MYAKENKHGHKSHVERKKERAKKTKPSKAHELLFVIRQSEWRARCGRALRFFSKAKERNTSATSYRYASTFSQYLTLPFPFGCQITVAKLAAKSTMCQHNFKTIEFHQLTTLIVACQGDLNWFSFSKATTTYNSTQQIDRFSIFCSSTILLLQSFEHFPREIARNCGWCL